MPIDNFKISFEIHNPTRKNIPIFGRFRKNDKNMKTPKSTINEKVIFLKLFISENEKMRRNSRKIESDFETFTIGITKT